MAQVGKVSGVLTPICARLDAAPAYPAERRLFSSPFLLMRAPLGAVTGMCLCRFAFLGIQHSPHRLASFLSGKNRKGRRQQAVQTYRYGPLVYGPLMVLSPLSNSRPQHRHTLGGRTDPICHAESEYPTGEPIVIFAAFEDANPGHHSTAGEGDSARVAFFAVPAVTFGA